MLLTMGALVAISLILLLAVREIITTAELRKGRRWGMLLVDAAAIILGLVFSYQMYLLIF